MIDEFLEYDYYNERFERINTRNIEIKKKRF